MKNLLFTLALLGLGLASCTEEKQDCCVPPVEEGTMPFDTIFTLDYSNTIQSSYLVDDQLLLIERDKVVSMDPESGSINWEWNSLPYGRTYLSKAYIVGADSTTILVGDTYWLYGIDLKTGKTTFREQVPADDVIRDFAGFGNYLIRLRKKAGSHDYVFESRELDGNWQSHYQSNSSDDIYNTLYNVDLNLNQSGQLMAVFSFRKYNENTRDRKQGFLSYNFSSVKVDTLVSFRDVSAYDIFVKGNYVFGQSTSKTYAFSLTDGSEEVLERKLYSVKGKDIFLAGYDDVALVGKDDLSYKLVTELPQRLERSNINPELINVAFKQDTAYLLSLNGALMRVEPDGSSEIWNLNEAWTNRFEHISEYISKDNSFFAFTHYRAYKFKF